MARADQPQHAPHDLWPEEVSLGPLQDVKGVDLAAPAAHALAPDFGAREELDQERLVVPEGVRLLAVTLPQKCCASLAANAAMADSQYWRWRSLRLFHTSCSSPHFS